jgi:low affinity Fe/Cu permease
MYRHDLLAESACATSEELEMDEEKGGSLPNPVRLKAAPPTGLTHVFSFFAAVVARKSGHIAPFIVATLLVLLWMVSGPLAHWSDTWQLVMNTISSAVTFLMVFVIQGSQTRDTDVMNAKLNEIIRSLPDARNEFLDLEPLSESQLQRLNRAFASIAHTRDY